MVMVPLVIGKPFSFLFSLIRPSLPADRDRRRWRPLVTAFALAPILLAGAVAELQARDSTLSVTRGHTPAPGDQLTIRTILSSGNVGGRAEGTSFAVGGTTFPLTYTGGDGNDAVLTQANAAPTISTIPPQTIEEDTLLGPLSFTVSDVDDDPLRLGVTATSSNQGLVPHSSITLAPCAHCAAPDAAWTLTATPLWDRFGTAVITVMVSDGRARTEMHFLLTVTDVQDAPSITYFLAEGATGAFFDTDLLIANPNPMPAPVTISFLLGNGRSIVETRTLLATSRTTIHVDEIAGLEEATFSTVVTSTEARPLAVERTMRWDATGYGAHTEKATDGAASTWYFAEGAQGWFSTYLLLTNPQRVTNSATVFWMREDEPVLTRTYLLTQTSRTTVDVSQDPELVGRTFGAFVVFGLPGMAERAMYFGSNPMWLGGHVAAGATAPSTTWHLAEGATGSYFTTFVLLANPGAVPQRVSLKFMPEGGDPVSVNVTVPSLQRVTVNIADAHPSLASTPVATTVFSAYPIVVERSQYWGQPAWIESHNSVGVTEPGRHWALAEGRVGGDDGAQTYILLANPGGDTANVTLTFLRTDGTTIEKTVQVPAARRVTVGITGDPQGLVPELTAETFGTRIDSTQPIVVERSLYSNANGVIWAAGTNATATALPQPR